VVAWGGDGTINEVAGALAFSEVVLGIVPGGSGNGLARDLGIPLDPGGALDVAATGQPRRIDGGQIDTALFFNVAGVGLDALIAQHIAQPRAQRGLAGYARLTLLELPRYRAERYGLEYDGRSEARDALFIAFANSRQYGNNARIAPAARLDDGELDLVVVEPQPLWRLVARMPDLFRGRLQAGTGVVMRTVTSVRVSSPAPLRYHADGEPGIGGPSIEVRVHAGALWVMTPVND
jgi:diacylglycerol kinase (ATP)